MVCGFPVAGAVVGLRSSDWTAPVERSTPAIATENRQTVIGRIPGRNESNHPTITFASLRVRMELILWTEAQRDDRVIDSSLSRNNKSLRAGRTLGLSGS